MRLGGRWTLSTGKAVIPGTGAQDFSLVPHVEWFGWRDGFFMSWLGYWLEIMSW